MFFHDMAGVFYAVVLGLVVSLFTLLCELTRASRKDKKHDQVGHIFIIYLLIYNILYDVDRICHFCIAYTFIESAAVTLNEFNLSCLTCKLENNDKPYLSSQSQCITIRSVMRMEKKQQ